MIIEASWILATQGDDLVLLRDHEVVVKDDLIEEVRVRTERHERLRLDGQILLPGFISGHTHTAAAAPTRGLIEENTVHATRHGIGAATERARAASRNPLQVMAAVDRLSADDLEDLTTYNLLEILRGGCTTQVEMSVSLRQARAYVRAASRLGARGYPSGMVPGIGRLVRIWDREDDRTLFMSVPETLDEIAANVEFARQVNHTQNDRIRPMMGPCLTSVHTRETFAAIRRGAEELGNGIHIHVQAGWNRNDAAAVKRVWGRSEVAVFEELGLFACGLFGAHLLGTDLARDLPILARGGFTFVHCPSAGGAGVLPAVQPYPEALAAGVNTSLGLDSVSNDSLENVKLAVVQGRAREYLVGEDSAVPLRRPTIWDALKSATLAGAKGLRRTDLGRIEAGAKADFATVDLKGLLVGSGSAPPEPHNNLLYANGLSVRNVMTDGNWQILDGRLVVEDESRIIKRGAAVVRALWDELEADGFFTPMPR